MLQVSLYRNTGENYCYKPAMPGYGYYGWQLTTFFSRFAITKGKHFLSRYFEARHRLLQAVSPSLTRISAPDGGVFDVHWPV